MVDLTLKWEKFGLCQGLHSMMESQELVDVTIMCQGQFLQAHKNVLAACSQQFRQIFKAVPDKNPIVVLKGVSVDHFKSILQFMYLGEVTVSQDALTEFISTADELGITALSRNATDTSQRPPPEPPKVVSEAVKTHSSAKSRRVTSANNESTEPFLQMVCEEAEVKMEAETGNEVEADDDWSGIPLVEDLDTSSETTTQHQPELTAKEGCYEVNGVPMSGSNNPCPSTSQGGESWIEIPPPSTQRTSTRPSKRKALDSSYPGSGDEDPLQSDPSTPQGFGGSSENSNTLSVSSVNPLEIDNTSSTYTDFICSYCSLLFCNLKAKVDHETSVHDSVGAKCDICNKILKNYQSLQTHRYLNHTGPDAGLRHVCDVCGADFGRKSHLKYHERYRHGDLAMPHRCQFCHKLCNNEKALTDHLRYKHRNRRKN